MQYNLKKIILADRSNVWLELRAPWAPPQTFPGNYQILRNNFFIARKGLPLTLI